MPDLESARCARRRSAAAWLGLLLAGLCATGRAGEPKPLAHAHAHNDYLHRRPLADALERGFCSIEADVFLVNGRLLVAHDLLTLDPRRSLQTLYLDPLRERVRALGGKVYRDGTPLVLLVDLKSDAAKTYAALAELLPQYAEMLSKVENGRQRPGAVSIVLSGNRPVEQVSAAAVRYVALDGRTSDLDSASPAHLIPIVSDAWTAHFTWQGEGPMPAGERDKLRDFVRRAHARQRVVRFWRTPESTAVWRELRGAGVDLINTDELDQLRQFLVDEEATR